MKKAVSCFLAILLCIFCFTNASYAEYNTDYSTMDFIIRNGICYGATLSDVKSIEDKNNSVQWFETLDKDKDGIEDYLSYKGQIAGYEGSQVFYYFVDTANGKLIYFYYRIGTVSDGNQKYSDIMNSLLEKYGEPDIRDIRYSTTSHPLFVHEYSPYEKYSQWFVKYADCYIVVTLYTEDIFGSLCCFLKYDLYSHSEMKTLFTQYQSEMDKIQNQKESDL